MSSFFVPYEGDHPAALSVKGHKLLIFANNPEILEDELELIGADWVRELEITDETELDDKMVKLAGLCDAGVVMAEGDVTMDDIMESLEDQLPWIH